MKCAFCLWLVVVCATACSGATATISLSSSANPSRFGASVILTGTVTPQAATGIVTFYDGTTVLGTKALHAGRAVFATSFLESGTRSLRALYSGDGSYTAATSSPVKQVVTVNPSTSLVAAAGSPFAIVGNPSWGLAIGDFNGDGITDLVVPNSSSPSGINILLGNGSGGFTLATGNSSTGGINPLAVAVGDFDGDGNTDLAVANWNTSTIMILLGNGRGGLTIAPGSPITAAHTPTGIAVADFNGDGIADMAVSCQDTNDVLVFLGNGKGSFSLAPGSPYSLGTNLAFIAAGDFNNDGNADLAATSIVDNTVSVLLGDGTGRFTQAAGSPYGANYFPSAVAIADFDGDGNQDLAIADTYGYAVTVLLGNGAGGFAFGAYASVGAAPWSIATGDFNGDGKRDLATSNDDGTLSVLLGDGHGNFLPSVGSPYAGGPGRSFGFAVGDFNGDGRADFALTNDSTNAVTVLLGAGNASVLRFMTQPANGTINTALSSVAVQAVDGNGNPLAGWNQSVTVTSAPAGVTATATPVNGVATFTNLVFTTAGTYSLIASSSGSIGGSSNSFLVSGVAAQLNFSAQPSNGSTGVALTPVTVRVEDALGNLVSDSSGAVTLSSSPSGVSAAVNAIGGIATFSNLVFASPGSYLLTASMSGFPSIASRSFTIIQQSSVSVASRASPSIYGRPVTLTATLTPATATGLITFYDGATILGESAVRNGAAMLTTISLPAGLRSLRGYYSGDASNSPATSPSVSQLVNSTPGDTFTQASGSPIQAVNNYLSGMLIADFNGDGKPDVAVADTSDPGKIAILLGNGSGGFTASSTSPVSVPGYMSSIASGDFNGDGKADLAVTIESGYSGTIAIFLGDGNGGFSLASGSPLLAPRPPLSLAVGDFNGDGNADLVFVSNDRTVSVMLGNGAGVFTLATGSPFAASDENFTSIAVADFNGDRKADLALASASPPVAGYGTSSFSIWLGDGRGQFTLGSLNPVPSAATSLILAVGDFDGNGKPDLAVAGGAAPSSGTPAVTLWLGNGDGSFAETKGSPIWTGNAFQTLAVFDANGDGKADLALSPALNSGYTGPISILLGDGAGGFAASTPIYPGWGANAIAVADFNGDGRADLLAAGSNFSPGYIGVILGASLHPIPSSITPTAGAVQSAIVGAAFAIRMQVKVTDTSAIGVSGVPVAFTPPSSGASGSFAATATVTTNAEGIATAPAFTANSTPGSYLVAAAAGALSTTFSLTNYLSQAITFNPLSSVTYGIAPFTISASASSGLAVTFTSNTPAVCTVSGNTVTILAAGGCSITASQTGNTTYAPATPVTQTFAIGFLDVQPTDYYFNAVNLLAQHGITAGCGNNNFCPTQTVTRYQMAIFIVRAIIGSDNFTASTTPYFTDVPAAAPGFKWIQKLYELGITAGCGSGNYCPNDNVTRDQMAVFIIRARYGAQAAFTYPTTPTFADVPSTETYFKWIQRLAQDGITAGCGNGQYCPNSPVIRGDMAIFLMRGAFNQLLPASTPVLSQINPATLPPGATGIFTVTGSNTHFVQGTTTLAPIPGVTIGTITVVSSTSLTVQLTAAANATTQPDSIVAITGNEQTVLPNGLSIQ